MKKCFVLLVVMIFSLQTLLTAQQKIIKSMLHNGVNREYIVYVPEKYSGDSRVPLMFCFHGYTMKAEEQMNWTGLNSVADSAGFILVYPQGTMFYGNTHWNVGGWTNGSTADDIGFTNAMIDTIADNYNIDTTRIYSTGFSNGGFFSLELACQLSERIAAVASVAGSMTPETYNNCNSAHPTPVLQIHGTADASVPFNGADWSVPIANTISYWVNFNNCNGSPQVSSMENKNTTDGSTVEVYNYTDGDNCVAVKHIRLLGGGHDWPGAWGSMDFYANDLIWEFLSQYDINGSIDCGATNSFVTVSQSENFCIYPNPSTDFLTLEGNFKDSCFYQIYSSTGKVVKEGVVNENKKTINISQLEPDIYVLLIAGDSLKFIKIE